MVNARTEALLLAFLVLKGKAVNELSEADEVLFWEHVMERARWRLSDITEERAFRTAQVAQTMDTEAVSA